QLREKIVVESVELREHDGDEEGAEAPSAVLAHAFCEGRILDQAADALGEADDVMGLEEKSALSLRDRFGCAIDACGYDRLRSRHALKDDPGETFPQGGQHEDVRGAKQAANVAPPSEEVHAVLEADPSNLVFDCRPQHAVTGDEEMSR